MGISVSVVSEKKVDFGESGFLRRTNILYVMAAAPRNTQSFDDTLKFLRKNLMNRTRSDKAVWLLGLDIWENTGTEERYFLIAYTPIVYLADNR